MDTFSTTLSLMAILLLSQPSFTQGQDSEAIRVQHVEARLVSEVESVQPGVPFRVGLLLKHDPHWHTYWKSSSTGYATTIDWDLPEGWRVSDIAWPTPEILESQDLVEYVYGGEVLLMSTITPPASVDAAQVDISFTAEWLMCADLCIPGSMSSILVLPVAGTPPRFSRTWADTFSEADARLPASPADYSVQAWKSGADVILEIQGALPDPEDLQNPGSIHFFDDQNVLSATAAPFPEFPEADTLRLELKKNPDAGALPSRLTGVLAASPGWPGTDGAVGLSIDVPVDPAPPILQEATKLSLGLLLLAFTGGLILNLMPCVFPVLGIKIMGFVGQAGSSRRKVIGHGLVFTMGVLASFWVLTAVLLLLRSGGNQLGWGFQLQSPTFVLLLALMLFAFALNMSGLFEVGQSAVGIGSNLTGKSGLAGTFFSGVLATVVATPCAAPFLAPALGAALTLPPLQSILVFTVIGLGLSTPYLLLSAFPGLVNKLPRPGPWMETFKQVMSFLLYATVAYLIWVLSGQLSNESMFSPFSLLKALFSLVVLALALWVFGRWGAFHKPRLVRRSGIALSVFLAGVAIATGLSGTRGLDPEVTAVSWQKWAPGKAEALAREGKTVYVDFTARWCVTCQTNKAAVFSSRQVRKTIEEDGIILLKADWTNQDPVIGKALQSFSRSAVPFNLVYGPGQGPPLVLPEILTPGIVLEAFHSAGSK